MDVAVIPDFNSTADKRMVTDIIQIQCKTSSWSVSDVVSGISPCGVVYCRLYSKRLRADPDKKNKKIKTATLFGVSIYITTKLESTRVKKIGSDYIYTYRSFAVVFVRGTQCEVKTVFAVAS